ncbi:MAG: hypothetical protein Q9215_000841 [Flavoplaca cf. flavocitrina]
MAATTTGVEAIVAKVLKAAADFREIAENVPTADPAVQFYSCGWPRPIGPILKRKEQEKLREEQEKLKKQQEKLKEQQEKLKEGHSSLIEARGHFEAEKRTAEDVLRNLRLSEGKQSFLCVIASGIASCPSKWWKLLASLISCRVNDVLMLLLKQKEKELERYKTAIRSRKNALEDRETQASLMDTEVKLRVETLQQHEESIKSGIEQKATDQMTRLISQLQLDQLPTQSIAAASSKFTRIEDCIAETEEAIINRLNALERSLQEKDDWKRLGEK